MALSPRTLETLLDLVEIKLSCMEVWDRDDRRELKCLEEARRELTLLRGTVGTASNELVAMARRRGRPKAAASLSA